MWVCALSGHRPNLTFTLHNERKRRRTASVPDGPEHVAGIASTVSIAWIRSSHSITMEDVNALATGSSESR